MEVVNPLGSKTSKHKFGEISYYRTEYYSNVLPVCYCCLAINSISCSISIYVNFTCLFVCLFIYLNNRCVLLHVSEHCSNTPVSAEMYAALIDCKASRHKEILPTASQMWCFGRFLPLLIGSHVPEEDEKWQLYFSLLEIVDVIFSSAITPHKAAFLKELIKDHHTRFVQLYPNASVIPKMHYMVHYPRTMLR